MTATRLSYNVQYVYATDREYQNILLTAVDSQKVGIAHTLHVMGK